MPSFNSKVTYILRRVCVYVKNMQTDGVVSTMVRLLHVIPLNICIRCYINNYLVIKVVVSISALIIVAAACTCLNPVIHGVKSYST